MSRRKNRTTSFDMGDVYDSNVTIVGCDGSNEIAMFFGNWEKSKKLVLRLPVGPATSFLVEQVNKAVKKQREAIDGYGK